MNPPPEKMVPFCLDINNRICFPVLIIILLDLFVILLCFQDSSLQCGSKRQVGDQSASLCIHHNTNPNLTKLYISRCTHLSRFVSGMNLKVEAMRLLLIACKKGASDVLASKDFEPSSPSLMPLSNELGSHNTAVTSVTKPPGTQR